MAELYGRGGSFNQGVKRRREAFSADRVIADRDWRVRSTKTEWKQRTRSEC
ncbi:hypothetical protein M2149_001819 [Lachnospiraceae bacterium PFB1-21]